MSRRRGGCTLPWRGPRFRLTLNRLVASIQYAFVFDTTKNRFRVNESFFDDPSSWGEAQAYWFGWLVADGYNSGKGICLRLAARDKQILCLLKDLIGYTGQVRDEKRHQVVSRVAGNLVRSNQDRANLTIYNRNLAASVRALGVTPGKASTFQIPTINPAHFRDFIRGVFDGDGCYVFTKHNHFESNLVGAPDMLQAIERWLKSQGITCGWSKLVYGNGARTLRISGNNLGMRMFQVLYAGCNYYLPRKLTAYVKLRRWKAASCLKLFERPLLESFSQSLLPYETQNPIPV